jgi:hypothetical protein
MLVPFMLWEMIEQYCAAGVLYGPICGQRPVPTTVSTLEPFGLPPAPKETNVCEI